MISPDSFTIKGSIVRWCTHDPECGGFDEIEELFEGESQEIIDSLMLGAVQMPCLVSEHERDDGSKYKNYDPIPDWPNNIKAAWGLVEEMGAGVNIRHVVDTYGDKWHCSFNLPLWYSDDTAPLAICRAYLAWKNIV